MHQPYRIRPYSVFDTGIQHDYFDGHGDGTAWNNEQVFKRVADKSYRPMHALLEKLLNRHDDFKISLSISGTFLEQAERWAPDIIASTQRLVATGRVEIVAETYHHSLAFFYSLAEFERQVTLHKEAVERLFGVTPQVFRNTELAYNDELALWAEQQGYKGILAEGWDPVLDWRSPNFVYQPHGTTHIGLLLKNYRLSDDIAFRFSNKAWAEWPLTTEKYQAWASEALSDQSIVNIFMDYETFGEHQWEATGIFDFFEQLIGSWSSSEQGTFYTVSEAIATHEAVGEISMPQTVTWADSTRDLSAWVGNSMQNEAIRHIYSLEDDVLRTKDAALIADWRRLLASDHTYYMCTKGFEDGEVHAYFSPYDSPYNAFLYYINAVRDIRWRLHTNHQAGGLHG